MNNKKKVALYSLGCKVNNYDTQVLREIFEKNGYEIVPFNQKANIYVINTCTVTHFGDKKSRQLLRRARRQNPQALIIAVGCYAQVSPESLEKMPEVDFILGTKEQNNIIEIINNIEDFPRKMVTEYDIDEVFKDYSISGNLDQTRAYVKVEDGCQQYCTYCIVPCARGPIRSRSLEDTVSEVRKLAQNNFKEIVLTGIHIASYGLKSPHTLYELISAVSHVPEIKRVRLSSLEPTIITKEFLSELKDIPEFMPHFHLSLQSGSNSVLKRMNRHYSTELYEKNVNLIRKVFPNAGITTDIIVGFPGETEEEFEQTLDFVKKIGFSKIHIFPFSPREGTPAAKFENQVDSQIKNRRVKELTEVEKELRNEFYQNSLGKEYEVLFERADKEGNFLGYTQNYLPVMVQSETDISNQILPVKLIEVINDKILAKIIERE